MTSSASESLVDEHAAQPIARIDAQDIEFIIPVREYVESNGCRALVNDTTVTTATYHIAVGDVYFVKRIFASPLIAGYRRLGVIIDSTPSDAESLANDSTKIVLVDPSYLSSIDVLEIFSFFFSGQSNVYDKRRNIHEPTIQVDGSASHDAKNAQRQPLQYGSTRLPYAQTDTTLSAETDSEEIARSDSERIGHILSDVFKGTEFGKKSPWSKKKKTMLKRARRFLKLALLGLCIIAIPFIWYAGSLLLAGSSYMWATRQLKSKHISRAVQMASFGTYWLNQSSVSLTIISFPFVATGQYRLVRGQERVLSYIRDISLLFSDLQKILDEGKAAASVFISSGAAGQHSSPAASLAAIQTTTVEIHNRMGLAEAQLSTLLADEPFPFSVPPIRREASRALSVLRETRKLFSYANNLLTLYPQVAGFSGVKTYLVLLQNSNELRPTGGFIGSIGVASFEDGVLSDFAIQDVYALDGQLKGHVDPPLPYRELLAQEHWYLRDSNWNPDFLISAKRASWFYEKETGTRVDGVMAVNVPVIVDVLKATGSIQLPDYNDRITAENFFGKSLYYTQHNFFPGSTQKKDFLGSLARAIMTKVMTDKDVLPAELFRAFVGGVQKRNIMFMFEDSQVQSLVEHFDWAGRMFVDPGCSGVDAQICLHDPFATSEANVSVSKVNYFISREGIREISLTPDGSISETVTLNIKNTANESPDSQAPGAGGAYTVYLRFLLPTDSVVNDVRLDDTVISSQKRIVKQIPTLPYIEVSDGPSGSYAIGLAFSVTPGTQKKLEVSYTRTKKLPFGKGGGIIDLLWYKHPGVEDMPTKTIITYPLYWIATNESALGSGEEPLLVAKDGKLEYNNTLRTDQQIRIKFIK